MIIYKGNYYYKGFIARSIEEAINKYQGWLNAKAFHACYNQLRFNK